MLTLLNKKFLLADDDADDANLFCEALNQVAPVIECHTAENGLELFQLLSKHNTDKPDVIFLDINMPIMNGWECLRKLKDSSNYKSIPTIMYSTSSAKRDIDLAYSLGASVFVTKPEDFRELSKILAIVATSSQDSLLNQLKGFDSVKVN
jgi:CheY-like chemotaxis protein